MANPRKCLVWIILKRLQKISAQLRQQCWACDLQGCSDRLRMLGKHLAAVKFNKLTVKFSSESLISDLILNTVPGKNKVLCVRDVEF